MLPTSARPLRPRSERQLVRAAADGDERAFAAIYVRFSRPLHAYCYSILGHQEDAADALQRTMAKAWTGLRRGEPENIKPWLYRIAHNESIDLARARRPHVELTDEHHGSGPDAAAAMEGHERLRELVSDLRRLTDRQRSALLMKELGGLSCEEIATALAISPGGTKQAIYEARSSLTSFANGRSADCEQIRCSLSAADRRFLRGRRLRAHLHDCVGCRDFEAAIRERQACLGALTPTLPLTAAGSILESIIGTGHGGGGALDLLGSAAPTLAGSVAVKAAAVVAVTATLGVGTIEVGRVIDGPTESAEAAEIAAAEAAAAPGPAHPPVDGHEERAGEASTTDLANPSRESVSRPENGGDPAAARPRGDGDEADEADSRPATEGPDASGPDPSAPGVPPSGDESSPDPPQPSSPSETDPPDSSPDPSLPPPATDRPGASSPPAQVPVEVPTPPVATQPPVPTSPPISSPGRPSGIPDGRP